jgi:hypothetical protein
MLVGAKLKVLGFFLVPSYESKAGSSNSGGSPIWVSIQFQIVEPGSK